MNMLLYSMNEQKNVINSSHPDYIQQHSKRTETAQCVPSVFMQTSVHPGGVVGTVFLPGPNNA